MSTHKCKKERKRHLREYVWNFHREPKSFAEVKKRLLEEIREVFEEWGLPVEGKL